MRYLLIIILSSLILLLISCVPDANKKCDDGQVLENESCVLKEQHIVVVPTPNPTIIPTPVPTIQPKLACGNIASGAIEVRTMYQTATVSEGQTCVSEIQNRQCTNGQLGNWSGSYTQSKCVISRIRYESATINTGETCKSQTQIMTCENAIC